MNWTFKSNIEVLEELGARVKKTRLERNIRQKDLADNSGVSLTTIQRLEAGKPINTLHFISILREFDMLETLDVLFPEYVPSPIQLKKMQGKQRDRASKK